MDGDTHTLTHSPNRYDKLKDDFAEDDASSFTLAAKSRVARRRVRGFPCVGGGFELRGEAVVRAGAGAARCAIFHYTYLVPYGWRCSVARCRKPKSQPWWRPSWQKKPGSRPKKLLRHSFLLPTMSRCRALVTRSSPPQRSTRTVKVVWHCHLFLAHRWEWCVCCVCCVWVACVV